ncbi:hypothetical protein FA13DRAFT_1800109 [Coprinellus micaceus]|uniref:Uncharacterized protein n=1 Tax=Coprinellus micaceus TaxID=71717 RepID=A0A4Y7SHQ0_COPMI|nr:hypothetical protein FA13DRAFT_1800109 [Coprinellus micaceus]
MLKSSSGLERDDAHSPRSLKPSHQPNLKMSPPVDELSVLEGAKEGVAVDIMSVSIPQRVEDLDEDPPDPWDTHFRLLKHYHSPQVSEDDPDAFVTSPDMYDSTNHLEAAEVEAEEAEAARGKKGEELSPEAEDAKLLAPFPNISSFELGEWFYGKGSQKSIKDFKALVRILTSPTFSLDNIRETKWTGVFQDLGKNKEDINPKTSQWVDDSGWKTTEVKIDVPVHYRMLQGHGVESHVFLHLDGHELRWKPNKEEDAQEFRIISELYNSDAFLEAQREIRDNPPAKIKDCDLPRVLVGLQFWSDATHLSTFSTSKLWPLYMVIGNESKFRRTKGDSCYHVAYFNSISDDFKDYLSARTGGKIPPYLMSHLNRECYHAQWVIILDDQLLEAISEGVVLMCSDGVKRRFFIRIFTYSSDYPERVLIATIKTQSECPCVRCLTKKRNLDQMGTVEDTNFRKANPRIDDPERRKNITDAIEVIHNGNAVNGDPVLCVLHNSNAPTVNAFSKHLGETGFDIFSTLVVDVLHEYEIGVFKALFIHLLRILEACMTGSVLTNRLNKRYRDMPTFNQMIRKFSSNVSELKRRAARDYEDILQCAIPSFHGLFPEPLDNLISKLLYINARWHALAKLRMQTDATIALLEQATSQLGDTFREFICVTSSISTVELQREADKRVKAATTPSDKKAQNKSGKKPPAKLRAPGKKPGAKPRASAKKPAAQPRVSGRKPAAQLGAPGARGRTKKSQPEPGPSTSQIPSPAVENTTSLSLLSGSTPPTPQIADPVVEGSTSPVSPSGGPPTGAQGESNPRKPKRMNISTPKFHALGHYPAVIRFVGPTDLYSTEWGESFHRSPKVWFKSTSKRFIRKELSMHERRRVRLKRARYKLMARGQSATAKGLREQLIASRNPDIHHYISSSKNAPVYLSQFTSAGNLSKDVACQFSVWNLKEHALPRFLRAIDSELGDATLQEVLQYLDSSNVVFKDERIYTHKIMCIKYTTYDTRKDEDIIHLDTDQCNVMFLNLQYSPGSSHHPFVYGKVIGVLHAQVGFVGDFGHPVGAEIVRVTLSSRFVDRDMFMRYEWGLGVGHTYAHKDAEKANLEVIRATGQDEGHSVNTRPPQGVDEARKEGEQPGMLVDAHGICVGEVGGVDAPGEVPLEGEEDFNEDDYERYEEVGGVDAPGEVPPEGEEDAEGEEYFNEDDDEDYDDRCFADDEVEREFALFGKWC